MKKVYLYLLFLTIITISFSKNKTYLVDNKLIQLISDHNLYSELDDYRLENGILEKELLFVKQLNKSLQNVEQGKFSTKKANQIVHLALQYSNVKQFNKKELTNLRKRLNRYVKYY